MPPVTQKCPGCGAPNLIVNPGILTLACEYCGTVIFRDSEGLRTAGGQSILPEGFSRFYRGAVGTFNGKRFVVLGRVRYAFDRGFWDEWHLELHDGSMAWMTEDNHEFRIEKAVEGADVPPAAKCTLGTRVVVADKSFVIIETGRARNIGIEGQIPKAVTPGEEFSYADGTTPDGQYSLGIEYRGGMTAVYTGDWLNPVSITMDDEGTES
ncbi:MAG: DUF4178 domain-containing protein [Myxococcota bacterium]|jgi:hypothetical protein